MTTAAEHFAARLQFETDASDVHAAIEAGEPLVLIDTRGDAAWSQGRARGALHMPTATIAARAPQEIPLDMPVVVYCWSPGCNGAQKAGLAFAQLGYAVKEMIGGFEYWAREGYAVDSDDGATTREVDELVGPRGAIACDC
jgi:rhodanese-related sulfurtransferase